jgi:hypothetical protein
VFFVRGGMFPDEIGNDYFSGVDLPNKFCE